MKADWSNKYKFILLKFISVMAKKNTQKTNKQKPPHFLYLSSLWFQCTSVQQTSASSSARQAGFKDKTQSHFFQEFMSAVMLLILTAPLNFTPQGMPLIGSLIDVCTTTFFIEINRIAFHFS